MKTKTKTTLKNAAKTSNPLDLLAPPGRPLCMDHDNNVSRIKLADVKQEPKLKITKARGPEITLRVEKIGTVRVDGDAL
jgi:hypothetical protein